MNRTDRLFAILLHLYRYRRSRAADLARLFEVSERTIYRDMTALSEMGVPLAATPGEGYELLENFELPPVMLTPDEALALSLGALMFSRNTTGKIRLDAEFGLRKVMAALDTDVQERIENFSQRIDFYAPAQKLDLQAPYLQDILTAIEARTVLQITYTKYMETETTTRDIEPHSLSYHRGAWYLSAYCHLRRDMRSFRLNRIVSLTPLDQTFTPRMIIPEKPQPVTVRIRFRARVLPHVIENQHYGFVHQETADVFVYSVDDLREIQGWVLGFGASAEVLAPESLRDALREEAERLIELLT